MQKLCVLTAIIMALTPASENRAQYDNDSKELLDAVVRARNEIACGKIEWLVTERRTYPVKHGVDHSRIVMTFDGIKRRSELFQRELVFNYSPIGDGESLTRKLNELQGDRDELVRLGLARWYDTHRRYVFDGSRLMDYDGSSTRVSDPEKRGSQSQIWDPRVLGLTHIAFATQTAEDFLTFDDGVKVEEPIPVDLHGKSALQIVVSRTDGSQRRFWFDAEKTARVVRVEGIEPDGATDFVVTSEFADDAMPTKIVKKMFRQRKLFIETTFVRGQAMFDVAADPAWWSLAGLDMHVGAPVTDIRIRQRIGYWDGQGLSQSLPSSAKSGRPSASPPHSGKLLDVAKQNPKTDLAFEAVSWIITNTPDGPDVERAIEIMLRDHIEDARMSRFCCVLESSNSPKVERICRAAINRSPHRDVQANAKYTLANYLRNMAQSASAELRDGSQFTDQAKILLQELVEDCKDIKRDGVKLDEIVAANLDEIQTQEIGCLAKDIVGKDIDGQTFKLSEYRGKVVVLTFSSSWCGACVQMYPQKRALVEKYDARRFAILSVNADTMKETLEEAFAENKITWRCWWDGESRSIAENWHVKAWPAVYVIDGDGIIRFKNVRGEFLAKAVQRLMGE